MVTEEQMLQRWKPIKAEEPIRPKIVPWPGPTIEVDEESADAG